MLTAFIVIDADHDPYNNCLLTSTFTQKISSIYTCIYIYGVVALSLSTSAHVWQRPDVTY